MWLATPGGIRIGSVWPGIYEYIAAFYEAAPDAIVGIRAWVRTPAHWETDVVASIAWKDDLASATARWLRTRGRRLTPRNWGAPPSAPFTRILGEGLTEEQELAQLATERKRALVLKDLTEWGIDPNPEPDPFYDDIHAHRRALHLGQHRGAGAADSYAKRMRQYGYDFDPADVEVFDPAIVFHRDGWMCQLCGRPVDRAQESWQPGYATLDHIIPVASRGPHTQANTQLAHLACNSAKGPRPGPADLPPPVEAGTAMGETPPTA